MSKRTQPATPAQDENPFVVTAFLIGVPQNNGEKLNREVRLDSINDSNHHLLNYAQNIKVKFHPALADQVVDEETDTTVADQAIDLGWQIGKGIFETLQGEVCRQAMNNERSTDNRMRDDKGIFRPEIRDEEYLAEEGNYQLWANVSFYRARKPRTVSQMQDFFSSEHLSKLQGAS